MKILIAVAVLAALACGKEVPGAAGIRAYDDSTRGVTCYQANTSTQGFSCVRTK